MLNVMMFKSRTDTLILCFNGEGGKDTTLHERCKMKINNLRDN